MLLNTQVRQVKVMVQRLEREFYTVVPDSNYGVDVLCFNTIVAF